MTPLQSRSPAGESALVASTAALSLALSTGDAPSKVRDVRILSDASVALTVDVFVTTIFSNDAEMHSKLAVAV
jgi:hypothetical protein